MRVSGTWRLVRARSRRRVRSWARAWRSSLQVRVITSTLGDRARRAHARRRLRQRPDARRPVQGPARPGAPGERARPPSRRRRRSTRRPRRRAPTCSACCSDVAPAQRTGGSDRARGVPAACARARRAARSPSRGAYSNQDLVPLVSPELRLATAGGGQHWQSVAIAAGRPAASRPRVMVGQDVTVPVDGTYQLFFLYSLQSEQDRLDFLQRTLGPRGAWRSSCCWAA